jgi:hypothetical protein
MDADRDGNQHADRDGHRYRDGNGHVNFDGNSHRDGHDDRAGDRLPDCHRDAVRNPFAHSLADANRNAH